MKICTKCNNKKDELEFAIKHKNREKRSNICKECHRQYTKKHYKENKVLLLEQHSLRRRKLRQQVLDKLDNKCSDCGCRVEKILEINHINGKGYRERKDGMYAEAIYKEVLETEGKYNLLCRVCNAKHYVESILGIKGFKVSFNAIVADGDADSRLLLPYGNESSNLSDSTKFMDS